MYFGFILKTAMHLTSPKNDIIVTKFGQML